MQTTPEDTDRPNEEPDVIRAIATDIAAAGGRAYIVGGAVRDELLGIPVRDIDVELYHIPPETARPILERHGVIRDIGSSFGIFRLRHASGEIDISFPRVDSKTGPGHRGFSIRVDSHLSEARAAERRDFTMNAMLRDPLSGQVFDYFGGQADLERRVLRIVSAKTFGDDPLRVLRGFQLAARFQLTADRETVLCMRDMVGSIGELPLDRLRDEWNKVFLADTPSAGLRLAAEIGFFRRWFPEFDRLAETPQDPIYHPEGDVWTHTLLIVDRVAELAKQRNLPRRDRAQLVAAALCHDIGKPDTTGMVSGRYRSLGHEDAGVKSTELFLKHSGFPQTFIDSVVPLVREHMKPTMFSVAADRGQLVSDGALRRLVRRLRPATLTQLLLLAEADYLARGPFSDSRGRAVWPDAYPPAQWWERQHSRLALGQPRDPILTGHDLSERGWAAGRSFGALIALADALSDDGMTRTQALAIIREAKTIDGAIEEFRARQQQESGTS